MKPKSILFVCTGNTCRSPIAVALLRHMLAKEGIEGIEIFSRGVSAGCGWPMTKEAVETLKAVGVEAPPHHSERLEKKDIEKADWIFVMTEAHRQTIASLYPDAKAKTRLLGSSDIADPLGGSPKDYEKCRIEIQNSLLDVLREVRSACRRPSESRPAGSLEGRGPENQKET
jgi:protein-tyrosine-phosphatase